MLFANALPTLQTVEHLYLVLSLYWCGLSVMVPVCDFRYYRIPISIFGIWIFDILLSVGRSLSINKGPSLSPISATDICPAKIPTSEITLCCLFYHIFGLICPNIEQISWYHNASLWQVPAILNSKISYLYTIWFSRMYDNHITVWSLSETKRRQFM